MEPGKSGNGGGLAIEARGLGKVYGAGAKAVRAVESLDLRVKRGEIFGLLGPNGAGKTTTIRLLCGLLAATEGEAFVDGVSVAGDPGRARALIGLVPGEGGHIDFLSAREELAYYGAFYGVGPADVEARTAPLLERLGLKGREDDRVGSYSKGMRRKLHLVRALVHEPPVLVLDEPTSGLDPAVVEDVWEILKALSRDRGVTILFSSHQLDEVERLCDRVSVIKVRLLAEGTLAELAGASGAHRIRLEGEAAPFGAMLSEADGVRGVAATGPELRFRIANGAASSPVPAVVAKLAAAGARILEVGPVETDLRALYRSIVGEAVAPGGPR